MSAFRSITPSEATGPNRQFLMIYRASWVPSRTWRRSWLTSLAALKAYLGFGAALSEGKLNVKQREQSALSVANTNQCDYCLSAHNVLGSSANLFKLPDSGLTTCVLTRRKVNYEQNSF